MGPLSSETGLIVVLAHNPVNRESPVLTGSWRTASHFYTLFYTPVAGPISGFFSGGLHPSLDGPESPVPGFPIPRSLFLRCSAPFSEARYCGGFCVRQPKGWNVRPGGFCLRCIKRNPDALNHGGISVRYDKHATARWPTGWPFPIGIVQPSS